MKTKTTIALCILFVLEVALIQGCATPTIVKSKQVGDASLTCDQLRAQYDDALEFEAKARKERTVTDANIVRAVLFWPALLGTYANTEEAIIAAKDRQAYLQKLADGKKCRWDQAQPDSKPEAVAPPVARPTATPAIAPTVVPPSSRARQTEQMSIAEVQKRLLELGYQPGPADGKMGKNTVEALKKFQQDNNLAKTGQADNETIAKLLQKK